MKICVIVVSLLALFPALIKGESSSYRHTDTRCNCICPDPSSVTHKPSVGDDIGILRKIYIDSSVAATECNCPNVVLPYLNLTEDEQGSFCPRCLCKYQTRNLTVIKVVVILVVWVVLLLLFYMAFLSILEPMLSKNRGMGLTQGIIAGSNVGYSEHRDSVSAESDDAGSDPMPMRTYQGAEGMINRLGTQQTKWKLQVQEQRRNIYDRHAMLN